MSSAAEGGASKEGEPAAELAPWYYRALDTPCRKGWSTRYRFLEPPPHRGPW